MRFLVDAQLPPALARWIEVQGHDAEHVALALMPSLRDDAIAAYAIAKGAVIVTKDSDFLNLAPPPPLLIVSTGNVPNHRFFKIGSRPWWRNCPAVGRSSRSAEPADVIDPEAEQARSSSSAEDTAAWEP